MDKFIGVCAAGWAVVCLVVMSQDAVTGAWLWVGSLALAPVVLLMVVQRRLQPAAMRALDVEAEAWCARAAPIGRSPGSPPGVARVALDRLEATAPRTMPFARSGG